LRSDAIRHMLDARDFERAADLIELAWRETDRSRQSARWIGWAETLPDEMFRNRPVLSVGYAWTLLDRGQLEAAEAHLREAEMRLNVPAEEIIVVDEGEFQYLPASIAAARAYLALAVGDVASTVKFGRRALDLLPEGEHLRRGIPASLLGVAYWTEGQLDAAEGVLVDSMISFQKAGNILFSNTGAYVLADIRMTMGRLRQAVETLQGAVQLAEGQGKFVLWGTADLHTGLSELYREQNNLGAAREHLSKSKELGEQSSLPRWRFRWCVAQARYMESCSELNTALEFLEEAERRYLRGPLPEVRSIAASKARIWIKQNRLSDAQRWMREQRLSLEDDPSFVREFEYITLARILIAQYKQDRDHQFIHDAVRLLDRLLKAAEEGGRTGSVIEILMLQALALEAQGDTSRGLVPLERALALAEPEGYLRIFVDEGMPMVPLLAKAVTSGIMSDYTGRLLSAFRMEGAKDEEKSEQPAAQPLVEPLSERELEVLRLIAQGLSNREIGERLFLALSTVKGYNRTIFGKLQVQRRTEAVARARELGLV
jgi:LuxR family transcriptional regulator, maltose regulon positive regulatory protein